jgi:mannose-6-phosphate isomerase-like protein (cupin superfamily)
MPSNPTPAPAPFRLDDLPWHEPPGHHGAFSQYLVGLQEDGATIEVRMSRCTPGGRVDSHVHDVAEHVYVFLSGTGEVSSDERRYPIEANTAFYVPKATEHSVCATGDHDLVFMVVTAPSGAIPR